MQIKVLLSIVLAFFISCRGVKEQNSKPTIYLVHRGELAPDYLTHDDYLLITNYESNTFTAHDIYNVALQYIDSVNKKDAVSYLTFLIPNSKGDAKVWNSEIWGAVRKYCIISFGFSNEFKRNINLPITLNDITIWKDGKPNTQSFSSGKKFIDSVLNSPIPLPN